MTIQHRKDQPLDPIQRAAHYNKHPSGVETIEIVEQLPFNLGNAVKYFMRAPEKGSEVSDLKKAVWYLEREVQRVNELRRQYPNPDAFSYLETFAYSRRVGAVPVSDFKELLLRVRDAETLTEAEALSAGKTNTEPSPLHVLCAGLVGDIASWRHRESRSKLVAYDSARTLNDTLFTARQALVALEAGVAKAESPHPAEESPVPPSSAGLSSVEDMFKEDIHRSRRKDLRAHPYWKGFFLRAVGALEEEKAYTNAERFAIATRAADSRVVALLPILAGAPLSACGTKVGGAT